MEITPLFITDLVSQIKQGLKIEEDKLDLKREWYDLKNNDSRDRDEFCKDIAAMANTTGPPGYIIIGIDEKSGSLFDSPFHKSGLDDKSKLRDIVVKRVDLPPRFDVKEVQVEDSGQKITVSVISVPPSIDKPHFVRKYGNIQNYIPIRKVTGIYPASRSDVERMYYDRKNIEPDYRIDIGIYIKNLAFNSRSIGSDDLYIYTHVGIAIQNTGRLPITISSASLYLENQTEPSNTESWEGSDWHSESDSRKGRFPQPFVLGANDIRVVYIQFITSNFRRSEGERILTLLRRMSSYSFKVKIKSINGQEFTSDLFVVSK